jgi:hypothetical protein
MPSWAYVAFLLGFIQHTFRHAHQVGLPSATDQLVPEVTSYTTQYKHDRRISMPSVGFEQAIPAIKQLETHCLEYMATGLGSR